MPIPTDPVKRICYADDLTVWASGVNIPDLKVSINNYLEEITAYLKDNSLLIFAPKSSVTLITPDTHQAKIHPSIIIENSHLPLVKCPRILGVYLDPSLSFNKHSQYVAERVSGRNHILKALAGTSWGQQRETLLLTYKAVAPNDTAYKRWSCHSGLKLLCKLCRTSPPPAMGARFTIFGMPAMRTRWMAAAHKSG